MSDRDLDRVRRRRVKGKRDQHHVRLVRVDGERDVRRDLGVGVVARRELPRKGAERREKTAGKDVHGSSFWGGVYLVKAIVVGRFHMLVREAEVDGPCCIPRDQHEEK